MKTIRVAEGAQADLLEIWEYLAGENPESAERLLHTFREKAAIFCFIFVAIINKAADCEFLE